MIAARPKDSRKHKRKEKDVRKTKTENVDSNISNDHDLEVTRDQKLELLDSEVINSQLVAEDDTLTDINHLKKHEYEKFCEQQTLKKYDASTSREALLAFREKALDSALTAENVKVAIGYTNYSESCYQDNNQLKSQGKTNTNADNIEINYSAETTDAEVVTIGYDKLLEGVKECMETVPQPSAPATDTLLELPIEKPCIYTSLCKTDKHEDKGLPIEQKYIIKFESNITEKLLDPLSDHELSEYYYNDELNQCQECTSNFIQTEINNETRVLDYFYELLLNYLKAKNNLKMNKHKIKELDEDLDKYISQMWSVQYDVEINKVDKCMDGCTVSVTQKFTQAKLNTEVFENFKGALHEIKTNLFENIKRNSFNCLRYKIKIEMYIQSLLTSCPEFTSLNESSPITLFHPSSKSYFQDCLQKLKAAIGILFMFQRKQKIDMSSSFLQETRQWLTDLVSILIRTGNWNDHLYILNQILRCPGGVGKWAANYIQFPASSNLSNPFSDPVINHIMTIFSILLQPIAKREDFMNEWNTIMNTTEENSWVIVDSDDEDDATVLFSSPLKENDMVLLLNQIPLKNLFSSVLGLNNGILDPQIITSNHLMKLFAFCSDFIKIIHSGLQVYSTQRYKQFAKRLGRLIRNIIEYVTFEFQYFKSNIWKTNENMARLQTEYDSFFLKATKTIYSSQVNGTWQFLAVVPYHAASKTAILKLYSILQLNEKDDVCKSYVSLTDFEEKFQKLPESEQFYLLSTFMNIALARNLSELNFKKVVVEQLFYVGFLGNTTKEGCYKNVKSLLYSLCAVHPFLMSDILIIQNKEFISDKNCDQSLTVFLWKELPVKLWHPTSDDLQVLSSWLQLPVQSDLNEVAKIIIKSLNYGEEQGDLFLPSDTHHRIALMIMQASVKSSQKDEKSVIRNVSNLVGLQEPEQNLNSWSWKMLLKLRLHLLDQSAQSIRSSFQNLNENLQNIPELLSGSDLHQLVKQKNSIACFIALMTTTLGHSVPVIYNEGFSLVEHLIRSRKSEAAVVCIDYMTLMFLECPDSLYKCQQFTSVLSQLITADYSYLKLAKNIRAFDTPGPILKSFESMIQNRIYECDKLGINRTILIELWLKSLMKIPLWIQEPGVIHLLDMLCKNAFFDKNASLVVKNVLTSMIQEITTLPTETKSSLSSIMDWMNVKCTFPTLLGKGFSGNEVWYFLNVLKIEQEIFEKGNFLWNELLKELRAASGKKINVDNCIKKACATLQIPMRGSGALTFYKLCYQILDTRVSHPLLVIMWQSFFLLYFNRVPDLTESVGEKFFQGIINQNLQKKLRQRLEETITHFKNFSESEERREYYFKCLNVFQVFRLWFDEPRLHETHLNLHLLSPQFNFELLATIINHDTTVWIDFVDHHQVQTEIKKTALCWLELKNRLVRFRSEKSQSSIDEISFTERIQNGLLKYEPPTTAPVPKKIECDFSRIVKSILSRSDSLCSYIRPSLKIVLDYSNYYVQEEGEHVGLGCDLQDLAQVLYRNKKTTLSHKQTCHGCEKVTNGKMHCSGPAIITLSFEESELDRKNNELFNQCLRNFNRSLQRALLPLNQNLCHSVVDVEKAVEEVKADYVFMMNHNKDEKLISDLRESGTNLFYYLIRSWTEEVSFTPVIAEVFEMCIHNLGKTFIIENPSQCVHILNTINDNPRLINTLQIFLNPSVSSTQDFVDLYAKVRNCSPEIRLVLLQRFDVIKWLNDKKPRFMDRSHLISVVGSGLKSFGPCPSDNFDLMKVFNSHLQLLLMHDFPEHYGEVLNLLLDESQAQTIPVSTWFMFLNSIAPESVVFVEGKSEGSNFEFGQSIKKLKFGLIYYATHQSILSLSNIRETILHVANTFKTDRLRHGLYGLYPKYRHYVEAIFIFCGMLSHAYIAETVKLDLGSLSVRIADQLWPLLRDLFSPWLIPYWSKEEKLQTAKWIQELTDDKCVLLPWVNSDVSFAAYGCGIFIESIRFVLDTLPGVNGILSHVWSFYVTNYAHLQVKDHVLRVIHTSLLHLPWNTFLPNLEDIESMVKIVEHFIPMSHSFLGSIFTEIKWIDIVNYFILKNNAETSAKLHICLLHLLVKLPCEPSLKQNNEVHLLLTEAKDFSWHLVDSGNYESVLNWFVMSCDPRIVLMDQTSEYYKLDSLILRILQSCAGFTGIKNQLHPTTLTKRLMYVRANIKWLTIANSRFRCKNTELFKTAVMRILNEIEGTINFAVSDSRKVEELAMLLSEFLLVFKEEELIPVAQNEIVNWLTAQRSSFFVFGLLRSLGLNKLNPTIFGNIMEASLECYFNSDGDVSWRELDSQIILPSSGCSVLQKAIIENSNFLTYFAISLKRNGEVKSLPDKMNIVSDILHALNCAKKSEFVEPKLCLFIIHVSKIAQSVTEESAMQGASILSRLSSYLVSVVNDKGSGLLSALGLKKIESFTTRFKFVCLVGSCGIMNLLQSTYSVSDKVDERILQLLDQAPANKQFQSLGQCINLASDDIKKVQTVNELIRILKDLVLQLFNKQYLK